jgi:hypothetical protein
MRRGFAPLFLIAVALLAVTYSTSTAQRAPREEARVPGLIDVSAAARSQVMSMPASVAVGQIFEITVTTSGGGCERAGDASVVLGESVADVMVYDMTVATLPNVACTMIYKTMPHTAKLRFTKAGEAVVRVWGRRTGADTPPFGVPAVIEQKVMVH